MSQSDITQIKVNNKSVGIIGLKSTLGEMAEEYAQRPDAEIQAEMIRRLSRTNHIPEQVKDDYGRTFLREFRKFLGQPYEEEAPEEIEIVVLGAGCSECNRLAQEVIGLVAELKIAADVEHVTDIKEIGKYGVLGTPALVINGRVVCVGRVPTRAEMRQWLDETA